MAHPYQIREIAQQAGLSTATVDRVLHRRPGVRASTVPEVHRAIADLDRQASQVRLGGRTFLIDLVMLAPRRFTDTVRTALEAELPSLRPAVVRVRFHLRDEGSPVELTQTLDEIGRRGSHGVVLLKPPTRRPWSMPWRGSRRAASRWSRWSPTCPRAGASCASAWTTGPPERPRPTC